MMSVPVWAVLTSLAMMAVATCSMHAIEGGRAESTRSTRPVIIAALMTAFYLALMVVVFAFFEVVVEPAIVRISS